MKVITIQVTMTQEQYDLAQQEAAKYRLETKDFLGKVVRNRVTTLIDLSNTEVDSNSVEVKTEEN